MNKFFLKNIYLLYLFLLFNNLSALNEQLCTIGKTVEIDQITNSAKAIGEYLIKDENSKKIFGEIIESENKENIILYEIIRDYENNEFKSIEISKTNINNLVESGDLKILWYSESEIEEINKIIEQATKLEKTEPNIFDKIIKENTKSLSTPIEENGLRALRKEYNKLGLKGFLKSKLDAQKNPNEDSKQKLVLNLISEYYSKNNIPESNVLDEMTWQDLNILCGTRSNSRKYLASQLTKSFDLEKRSITATGIAEIYRKLLSPITSIEEIKKQQNLTKQLLENENLFNELDTKLKNILVPENIVLSFWNPEDVFCTYVDFEPLRCRIFLENKAEIIKKYSDFINKSPLLLETYYKYNDSLKYISKLFMFYGAIALPSSIIFGKNILPDITIFGKNISPNVEDFKHLSPTTFSGVLAWTIGLATSEKTSDKTKTVISTWNNEKNVIEEIAYFDETAALFKYTHKKISLLSEYLTNIKEIEKISLEYPEFAESLPVIKNFSKMLQELREKSPNFDTLINLLETKTIKGKYCRLEWFSRVSIAYRLMNEQKENFIPLMLAVGEIDAQLTIAKIYKDFQNKDVTFCFPEFIENSETPQLSIKDFWNPLLDPEKVVTNSIDLGCNGHPRNVIITGPIAGGKSTITTAIIYSAILAQTLGIAPAKELKMSMFNFIRTYFKITEDIAAGLSHFNAGVTRAMQLLVTAKNLKDNDFAIFGVDELFNGTSEDEAKPPVETFLQELGENSKVILITNTHLHEITNLEKTGFFENCQVPVLEKENDEIEPLYKIIPGISMQNDVVLKLLAKRGINPEFIKKAQNLLENKKQKKLLTLQNETREI